MTDVSKQVAGAEAPFKPVPPEAKLSGLPVHGYKMQTGEAVRIVNMNKEFEETILRVLDGMKSEAHIDQRWLAIGRTQIEQGFMAINRAVFQPDRIRLPSDGKDLLSDVTA